jgi:hypothetical protein
MRNGCAFPRRPRSHAHVNLRSPGRNSNLAFYQRRNAQRDKYRFVSDLALSRAGPDMVRLGDRHAAQINLVAGRTRPPSQEIPFNSRLANLAVKLQVARMSCQLPNIVLSGYSRFWPGFPGNLSISRRHSLDSLYPACTGPRAMNGAPSTSK